MFALIFGAAITGFGTCLLTNFRNLADRLFDYYSSTGVTMGSATAGTLRVIGGGTVLIGLFWIATAVTEIL
ncbi:hypothetical protein ACFVRD_20025 [Streptomyces sp. NPDC057908]|uniref:hypothetical protein n=1 Tax=unclassified Streptomyces TaxID=2593676 RepID=UPI002E0E7FE5|nr:hypothetical protein OG609_35655 [Streptomyces sp. NBC_01224]